MLVAVWVYASIFSTNISKSTEGSLKIQMDSVYKFLCLGTLIIQSEAVKETSLNSTISLKVKRKLMKCPNLSIIDLVVFELYAFGSFQIMLGEAYTNTKIDFFKTGFRSTHLNKHSYQISSKSVQQFRRLGCDTQTD